MVAAGFIRMREGASRIRLGVRQSIEELTGGRISTKRSGGEERRSGDDEGDVARLEVRRNTGTGDWERAP